MNRSPNNPILTRTDIPDIPLHAGDVSSVFNPGAIKLDERYFLLLRVQTRGRVTLFMIAESADGVSFRVQPRVLEIEGINDLGLNIFHLYDPRLTKIGEEVFIVFAADTDVGCRIGIARTRDFQQLELVSFQHEPDLRNGVLFPEMRRGKYLLLERPNQTSLDSGVRTGDAIVLAQSGNLIDWDIVGPVMSGRPHYWDELIGSGPPPIKTREGWLHIYHGVATHFASANIYQAGVVLLNLDDPTSVISRSTDNILEPREMYEMVGQVPNVIFPSGMIVEEFDDDGFAKPGSLVRVYYGAADTCIGLATTTIGELIEAARR